MKFIVLFTLAFLSSLLSILKSFAEAKEQNLFSKKTTSKKRSNKKPTTKNRANSELTRLLTIKRNSAFEKLLAQRQPREDDDIPDPYVVYRIAFASHSEENSSCPYPLYRADSYTSGITSGDLNKGKGGDYVYLCIGRKRISELTGEENFINKIYLNINQENCGQKMQLLKTPLKSSFFLSDSLSFCLGYSKKQKPWSNIKVFSRTGSQAVPEICKLEITEGKFLCFETADEAPFKIEFSDLNLLTSEENAAALGKAQTVAEIDNDNTAGKADNTIKRSVWITKFKSAAWNLENKFSKKVDIKFSVGFSFINSGKFSASASYEMSTTENKGTVSSSTDLEMIDFNCLAPKGKYYKCRASITKVESNMPYEIKRTIFQHNGMQSSKVIKSNFEGVMSSSVRFQRCCYKNCDPQTENVCPGWVKDSKALSVECPILEGVTGGVLTPAKEEKITLQEHLDPLVVADVKVIVGHSTTCPPGYMYAKKNDLSTPGEWDNASRDVNKRYICYLKKKVSKLHSAPINIIRPSFNNKDCGTLNQVDTSITEPELTYICAGHDSSVKIAPVKDIYLITQEFKDDYKNKTFLKNMHCNMALIKERFYLCVTRENNAPKKIQITDFKYDYTQMQKQQTGPPKKIKEVIVSSATLTETVKITKRTETSLKTVLEVGKSVGVSLEGNLFGVSTAAGFAATTKNTQTSEEKKAEENMEVTTVDCIAQDKKVMKCISTVMEYRMRIPYTAKMQGFDYQGLEMPAMDREIKGVSEEVGSSNIIVKSCCLNGCCSGDEKDLEERPHCVETVDGQRVSKGRDITCGEMERCFLDKKSKRRWFK